MKPKNLGMALVVVLALAVVAAGSASASTVATFDVEWYTGTSPGTRLSGSEIVAIKGESQLIGKLSGTPVTLKSTEVECVECTIQNTGEAATGSGKLRFKNVTVVTPSTCAARSVGAATGTVETKPLSAKADYMETSTSTVSWVLLAPIIVTGNFAEIELVKGTGGCAVSGTYTVTGNDYVKENDPTGTFAVNQAITSSGAINAGAGGELKFGGAKAELNTNGATVALSGAKKGTAFTTK